MRNRLTLVYAVVMPLLPLGLLFVGERRRGRRQHAPSSPTFVMALMFPVYYNLLSMFVSRRDELVLKRLRTGEVRDLELVHLDGAARRRDHASWCACSTIAVAMVAGLPFPLNPLLLLRRVAAGLRRDVRGLRAVDRGLDQDRRGGPADQPPGGRARPRRTVRAGVPGVGAAVARPAARRRRQRPGARRLVRSSRRARSATASTSGRPGPRPLPALGVLAAWSCVRRLAGRALDALGAPELSDLTGSSAWTSEASR